MGGSKSLAPRILNLGTSWRWVVNLTPRRFASGDETWYQFKWTLNGLSEKDGYFGHEKKHLLL